MVVEHTIKYVKGSRNVNQTFYVEEDMWNKASVYLAKFE